MSAPGRFDQPAASWCHRHGLLRAADAPVLAYLAGRSGRGRVERYDATSGAAHVGLGPGGSGRRTFGEAVTRLEAAGALTVLVRPWGHHPGTLIVTCYDELTRMARATSRRQAVPSSPATEELVLARADEPISRALPPRERARDGTRRARTRATPADSRAPGFSPRPPAHGGVLPSEELFYLAGCASSAPGQPASQPADWIDDDLEDLVAPLVEACRRTGRPGLNDRPSVLAALRPFTRAQVRHAVSQIGAELVRSGSLKKPFGYLISVARSGSAEYFPSPGALDAIQTSTVSSSATRPELFVPAQEAVVVSAVTSAREALRPSGNGKHPVTSS